ncbi:putative ribose ABC transporter [Candidatus Moduliflexus flocculans]|uniref:Putative ribose ABC transporter n=1 Tax=Candidatus Moduliflexus flocculans TaxID=1499966 RepID=A0A0S6VWX1_9BACT|nr:putative ribose ABC transporter [Candidatus Moduliflexus flocculans]
MDKTIKTLFAQVELQKVVLLGIIAAITILLSIVSPNFFMVSNFTNVLLQVAVIIIIASAANLLMITTNFDLSVGSVLAFSGIIHAYMCKHGIPIGWSIVITCAGGIVWGAINSLTVGVLNINPVIATMGTMYAARGFAFLIARWDGGANIMTGLPMEFVNFGRNLIFGKIPLAILFTALAIAIFMFIEKKTILGRFVYAIGGNASAAKLSGINVVGVISLLYIIIGLLSALCGVLQASRVGLAAPNVGRDLEFDVIIAIVLGGTSMLGGEGSTFGMILGALIVGLAANGLNLNGVPYFYQTVVKGLLLISAVLIDQKIRNRG